MIGKRAKILAQAHVEDLLFFAQHTRHPIRNQVIVLLSLKAGLRAAEIANLTWDMVVDPTGEIATTLELQDRVAKKGSGRVIPVHPDLREALMQLRADHSGTGDGTVYHLNISWALPVTWPAAVYSLEVGIVGTTGVLTIDDTHRDIVLAVSKAQSEGYNPDATRLVDFMGSYPPGDMALGELRGPMAEETDSWLNRIAMGLPTAAATVEEAHRNLMLTKALDLSAKRKQPVKLPLDPDDVKAAA